MEQKARDWELVPISQALDSKFGFDIYPTEFNKIAGDLSLVKLSDPIYLRAKAVGDPRAPIIKKGAEITNEIINTFLKKNCTVLPVLRDKPLQLKTLSDFAKKQTLLLAGRIFNVVDSWLDDIRKDRSVSVLHTVRRYRKPLLQSLNNALKDWEAVTITLVNDILCAKESLSILSLFDEFIGGEAKQIRQKEHSIEVTVLALMLGRKCNLNVHELKNLGLAGLIHDIGMVVYEQKLHELMEVGGQLLEPDIIKTYFDKHPFYGAILLSKKNGEPIAGINSLVRSIVLEHEQKIDGAGPRIKDKELKDELEAMNIPENVIYLGSNKILPDASKPKEMFFPGTNVVKRYMSISSQILHVSEMYVSTLDRFKRRGVKDPHKETIKVMVKQAGTRINGRIFEVFFNHLIPPEYYPENLVITLNTRSAALDKTHIGYHKCIGVVFTEVGPDGKSTKKLRIFKGPDGKDLQKKITFDMNEEKKRMYLVIDDWNRYNK
ncbi:HD-GYP domain-containing protein [candidate division KSB1 bacterium]